VSAPVSFALAAIGLIVSAKTRLNMVLFGQPVSISYLGLLFAVAVLVLLALLLYLAWLIVQERPRPSPYPRCAT
jgi:hypothetical protein